MTTDQLEDTEQVEETGAQVDDGDGAASASGDTDGHTEAPAESQAESGGVDPSIDEDDQGAEEPTESVVQSDSSADTPGAPDVDGTDGDLGEDSSTVTDQDDSTDEESRFAVEVGQAVPPAEAEGDEVDFEGKGAQWLEGLFERMELDIDAEFVEETDDRVSVNLDGPDAERLLGRGKTGPKALEAVETIVSRVFAGHPRSNDIYLDVNGAREARTERLEDVADDLADQAVKLTKNVTISGLNSSERRVIHHRLREDDRVETESVGEGIFRRLRIEPRS